MPGEDLKKNLVPKYTIKMQKYKFFNLPKRYLIKDYIKSINHIVRKYSKIKDLVSIYNWGSISTPGISDIDLVFVFKSDPDKLPLLRRSFYFLNSKTRYLVRHPFIFIDEHSFQNVRYVYPVSDLKLLYGNDIKIRSLSAKEEYYSKIALLNDIIIRHYPRDFMEQSVNKKINIRDNLLRLNSLKYSINILEEITKKNTKLRNTLNIIKDLRSDWFKSDNFNSKFEMVALLNKNSIDLTMEIVDRFNIFLKESGLVKADPGKKYIKITYRGKKNRTIFIKDWNKEKSLKEMYGIINNGKRFHSVLPIGLSGQLIEYSKYGGLISEFISKNISSNFECKIEHNHREIMKKRINILNEQAKLASRLKHSDFPAFFDFGYRNKDGINNLALNLLDKFRK